MPNQSWWYYSPINSQKVVVERLKFLMYESCRHTFENFQQNPTLGAILHGPEEIFAQPPKLWNWEQQKENSYE